MKLLLAFATAALLTAPALAASCRDAKGKFIKCPPAGTGTTAAMSPAVTKDAKGKCHVAAGPTKGRFTACPK